MAKRTISSPSKSSRSALRNGSRQQWVSANDVDNAVEQYVKFILDMQYRTTHDRRLELCLDQHRNQVLGCNCIFELHRKKKNRNNIDHLAYAVQCDEMACWFSAAKETERIRLLPDTWMSRLLFHKIFHKTVVIKNHGATGSVTKMVDVSIVPSVSFDERKAVEDSFMYLPVNNEVTESAFCLNTILGIWKILSKKKKDFDHWETINYHAILYQGARNQLDLCTQKKRQRLFYSRIGDFSTAAYECKLRVPFKCASRFYQESGELGDSPAEVSKWKSSNWYNWRNWQLHSIHVLVANSFFEHSPPTQKLVSDLHMAITIVDDSTVDILRELVAELWRRRSYQKWDRTNQDKALRYIGFPNSHSVLSALDGYFDKHGGHVATGKLYRLLRSKKGRQRISLADEDIRDAVVRELECKLKKGTKISPIAIQPSFMMSEVHKPQLPHFDYSSGVKNRTREVELGDNPSRYWIGFLPVTDSGQFLQFWNYEPNVVGEKKGEIVFIPKGHLVIVPGNTLHGGGFRAATELGNEGAHGRVHFYIYPGHEVAPIDKHINELRDPSKGRRVPLDVHYKNSDLLDGVLRGGDWCQSMNWSFFQGECPIDKETGIEARPKKHRREKESRSDPVSKRHCR